MKPAPEVVKAIVEAPEVKARNIGRPAVEQFMMFREVFIKKTPEAMLGVLMAKKGGTVTYLAGYSTGTTLTENKFKVEIHNTAIANQKSKLCGADLKNNQLFMTVQKDFEGCLFRFLSAPLNLEAVSVQITPKHTSLKALPQWQDKTGEVKIQSVCAAVKLVQYCNDNNMLPLALSEIWFGTTQTGGTGYVDGETIESCINCRQILPYMLCPLTVADFSMQVSKPDKPNPELRLPGSMPNNNNFHNSKMEQQ